MKLNFAQRCVVLAGLGVFVLMGLVPPWKSGVYSQGYSFVAAPPVARATIDVSRFVFQSLVLAVVTAGAAWAIVAFRQEGKR